MREQSSVGPWRKSIPLTERGRRCLLAQAESPVAAFPNRVRNAFTRAFETTLSGTHSGDFAPGFHSYAERKLFRHGLPAAGMNLPFSYRRGRAFLSIEWGALIRGQWQDAKVAAERDSESQPLPALPGQTLACLPMPRGGARRTWVDPPRKTLPSRGWVSHCK